MIKVRIDNYKIAQVIFNLIEPIWWGLLKRGAHFEEVVGRGYKSKKVDHYYLVEFK